MTKNSFEIRELRWSSQNGMEALYVTRDPHDIDFRGAKILNQLELTLTFEIDLEILSIKIDLGS